jgi:hypothetical protein
VDGRDKPGHDEDSLDYGIRAAAASTAAPRCAAAAMLCSLTRARMTGGALSGPPEAKGGAGAYFDLQLDRLRRLGAGDLGNQGQREIDARRHASAGEDIAVAP